MCVHLCTCILCNDCVTLYFKSDSDSDFEKFLENRKQKQKKKESASSANEVKNRTTKQQRKKARKVKDQVEHSPKQYRDKENLLGELEEAEEELELVKAPVPPPPRPRFKRRPSVSDQNILESFIEEGLDKEDVQMFKLALARLKGEGDSLVEGLPWAHYPHNILCYIEFFKQWSCD